MLKLFIFAAAAVTSLPQILPFTSPVRCGQLPTATYSCLGIPKLVTTEISARCQSSKYTSTECERVKCIFKKSGWMKKGQVDKPKVVEHFNQFGRDHPTWYNVTELIKRTCLLNDLAAQGVYITCRPYDIIHCAVTTFLKHAQPSQWSSSPECQYPRQYATSCPHCPEDCFAPIIPVGSCNACRLPNTP